jgi:two-component system, cell cycle response regulator
MTTRNAITSATYAGYVDQLPSLPSVTLEVLTLCRQESVEVDDLVKAISRDPALTARVLKIGNSPLYARRGPASTLDEAIVRLGIKAVMVAVLSFSLTVALPVSARLGEYDVELFWRRSMIESVSAKAFAQRLGRGNDREAFTCALLMDIGIPLFAKAAPGDYAPVVAQMDGGHPDLIAEETAVHGNHAELAAYLLREWRLPESMAEAVAGHHDPDAFANHPNPGQRDLVRILHLAHLSAGVIMSDSRAMRLRQLEDRVASWFGKASAFVDSVLGSIERGVQEFAEAIRIAPASMSPMQMLEAARMELINVSMAAASALSKAESKVAELENRATTDALTGLFNRGFFDAAMTSEWDRRRGASESTVSLGLIMVDVDHFKRFNDTYGHQTGDEVLRTMGRTLRSAVRDTDFVCRYGGEEFGIICPGTAGPTLRVIAERVRKAVENTRIKTPNGDERVTVSLGACVLSSRPGSETYQALVSRADSALYEAKRTGRNKMVCAADL